MRFANGFRNDDDAGNAGNPFNQIGAEMGYAADYDTRERFGDLPCEVDHDGRRAGLAGPVNNGDTVYFKGAGKGDANIPTESSFEDMAAKIARAVGTWIGRGW